MKLSKIAFAVASTLVIASGAAFAGQIGSSSVTVATEVIVADTQIVRAPSNNYNFAGNIDARTNQQLLQLQYTLDNGIWGSTVFPGINTLVPITPSATSMLRVQYLDGSSNPQNTFPAGTTINAFVTGDRKTLVFNITIPANSSAANLLVTPNFTVNSSNGAGENAGVSGLFTVTGVAACPAPDKNVNISFKHFTTHNGNSDLIINGGADSEHVRPASTNSARLLNFVQNLVINFAPSASASRTDAAFLNDRFVTTNAASNFAGTPAPVFALGNVSRHYIGRTNLTLRATGVDLAYVQTYGNADGVAGFSAADFDAADNIGNLSGGQIEIGAFAQTLTVSSPWPAGTVLTGYNAAGTAILATAPSIAGQTVFTLSATTAAQAADFASGVYLIAQFPGGGAPIPPTAGIATRVSITKASVAGTPDLREQDLACPGTLTGIGGGIKIDVRNYASKAKFPTGNYASYVRLINNSESQAADVFAQMIYADGTYGPYGQLPTLAPRAVANYSNAALEALMTTAPATANPFGTATAYTQTPGTTTNGTGSGGNTAALGDRVRFVSNTGTTLRIQSYILLPNGNLLDTTNAQGVDFENTSNNRTPSSAVDAQPVSQDAINGLAR